MQLTYTWDGQSRQIECFDRFESAVICHLILDGTTYPHLPFVPDVEVIMDVGANCGSASTWFSLLYPSARIFAFEPAAEPYRVLRRNTDPLGNVTAVNIGLFDENQERDLFHGATETETASIYHRFETGSGSERIELRSARGWFEESGLDRLDVIKVDTEGCELPILRSLGDLLAGVKIIYLEFHSEPDRKAIDALLGDTHSLFFGRMVGDEGELAYVSRYCTPQHGTLDLGPLFSRVIPG